MGSENVGRTVVRYALRDLSVDVLAAPESALCGCKGVTPLYLPMRGTKTRRIVCRVQRCPALAMIDSFVTKSVCMAAHTGHLRSG